MNPRRVVTWLLARLAGLPPGIALLPVMALMGLFDDAGDTGEGDQGGGDAEGSGDGEGVGGDQQEGAGDPPDTRTVTMTQAELDALIDKRLGRAKTKWETDAKTAADRAKMDEAQRAAAEKADAEAEREAARQEARQARVEAAAVRAAIAANVDPDRVDRFLTVAALDPAELVDPDGAVDTAAVAKAIKAAATDWPEFVRKGGPGRSGGDLNGGHDEQPKSLADAVSKRLATTR